MGEKPGNPDKEGSRERSSEEEKLEKFHDIKKLSPEEAGRLIERVEENNGVIRVIVHPFFVKENTYRNWPQNKAIRRMEKAIKKMADMDARETPPIFMMAEETESYLFIEDRSSISALSKNFDRVENDIYVIPTHDSDPQPRMVKGSSWETEKEDWKELVDFFEDIGVKKVIIGGMSLNYNIKRTRQDGRTKREIAYGQCVGGAYTALKEFGDFDVEFSAITYPESKNDLRRKEKEIAQIESIEESFTDL